jgi:PAS domain S-box-containing protein
MSAGSSTRFLDRRDGATLTKLQGRVDELERLLDAVDGIVWQAESRTFRFTYVSAKAERLLGYPISLWTSEPTFWEDHLHPEDREWAMNFRYAGVDRGHDHELEYRMIAADGRSVWLRDLVTVDPAGGPDAILRGVMIDVSTRRQAEDRFARHTQALLGLARSDALARGDFQGFARHAFEIASRALGVERISVWLFNDDRTLLQCHHLYERSAERHSSGVELEAQRYPRYFSALSGGLFVSADDAQTDPNTNEFTEDYLRPLGITSMLDAPMRQGVKVVGVVCHEHVGAPRHWMPDEREFAAAVAQFIGHALEVQRRQEAEARAREAQDRLLEQERRETQRVEAELERVRDRLVQHTRLSTIGQTVASIAHELRNPLAVIQNARFFLSRHAPGNVPKWSKYLDIIDQEVNAADSIIIDLLEITRAKDPSKRDVDLVELARSAFDRVAPNEGLRLELRVPAEPFLVHADPDMMRQVLRNLMLNSGQALNGRGNMVLEAREREDQWVLTFADDGPGIPADILDRVFEPLFTTKAKGTGLGLPICRQIVEQHGGSIDVVRDAGSGARLTIRLPRPRDRGRSREDARE